MGCQCSKVVEALQLEDAPSPKGPKKDGNTDAKSDATGPAKGAAKNGAKSAAKNDKEEQRKANKEENQAYSQAMQFLAKVNLLKRLPSDQLPLLAANMQTRSFKQKDTIIEQGDVGTEFFVIRKGVAKVFIDEAEVATLKAGDYFGEMALLREDPRMATVKVTSPSLEAFAMSGAKFKELQLPEQLRFANRHAVGGGTAALAIAKMPSPKTEADKELIADGLRNNIALSTTVTLESSRVNKLIDVAWKEEVAANTLLVEEGDLVADFFYIVHEGGFEIFSSNTDEAQAAETPMQTLKTATRGDSFWWSFGEEAQAAETPMQTLKTATRGDSFGEMALLYLTPRTATVRATMASVVWVIDRTNFKNILMQVSERKLQQYAALLDSVSTFESMLVEERRRVAKAMVEMHYGKDDIVLLQGEPGSTFYILYEGEVAILKDGKQIEKLSVAQGSKPQYFGEGALLKNEKRGATVKVMSETAKALALDKRTFDMVMKPLSVSMMAEQQKGQQDSQRPRIRRADLKRIGLLGNGGFGSVELHEHVETGETYAMKILSKGYIVKARMQESVMNEKNILIMTNSDFVVKLYETYSGQQSLYFLMEPALGGELYATYNRRGFHGSEKHAKFYVAGVVFAFEHIHERHVIYRDLKPENLLITQTGRIKLTDMGLAKFVLGKTFSTCGTPDYFAPEVIASSGHSNAVDWWTLGVLLFELMSGRPPFESAQPMQTYSKVMKGIGKVSFPSKCTGLVEPLIKGLCKMEPSERLAMRPGGAENIKTMPWYAGFDWRAMKDLTLEPPYRPVVKSRKDIANFSARKEDMPRQVEYRDDGSGWDKEFATQSQ